MNLIHDYEKIELNIPEFPGILMIEPSKIPIFRFDCKIMEDLQLLEKGNKIKIDILPIELGSKLILHTKKEESNQTVIKLSQIKNIGTSEKQEIFMNHTKLLVEILLKNNTKLKLEFDDIKEDEFISLVNENLNLHNRYWKFYEVECREGNNLTKTKMYYQTPFLSESEELLWSFVQTDGILDKKTKFLMALTNLRAIIYYFDSHECECALLSDVDDILVTKYSPVSPSKDDEDFSSEELNAMRIGRTGIPKEVKSPTKGDVVFMRSGEKIITFGHVTNPNGLAHFVKSLIKDVPFADKKVMPNYSTTSDYAEKLAKYLENSDWENLEKLANFILEKNPDDYEALRAKLGAYLGQQKWEKIVEVSEHILKLYPENFDARIQLPEALLNLKEIEKAQQALKESLDIYPDDMQLLSIIRQIENLTTASSSA